MEGIKLTLTNLEEFKCEFTLENCDISLANSLRRILLAEIETIAIHNVKVYENTSSLPDEYIAHRLGLIPLNAAKVDDYNYIWNCNCQGECDRCTIHFDLKVYNGTNEVLEVTSLDLKQRQDHTDEDAVRPIKVYSILPDEYGNKREVGIPIIKLSKGQQIHFECEAQKGIGKMHSKWNPVCISTFSVEPEIIFDQEIQNLDIEQKKALVNACPTKVFGINPHTNTLEVQDHMKCMYCEECVYKCTEDFQKPKLIKIDHKKDKFFFKVETTGVMKPVEVLRRGFSNLRQKLDFMREQIQENSNNQFDYGHE
ncbi:hypothetical protein ABPG74_010483 [Tetrahymena malaccensis]